MEYCDVIRKNIDSSIQREGMLSKTNFYKKKVVHKTICIMWWQIDVKNPHECAYNIFGRILKELIIGVHSDEGPGWGGEGGAKG